MWFVTSDFKGGLSVV